MFFAGVLTLLGFSGGVFASLFALSECAEPEAASEALEDAASEGAQSVQAEAKDVELQVADEDRGVDGATNADADAKDDSTARTGDGTTVDDAKSGSPQAEHEMANVPNDDTMTDEVIAPPSLVALMISPEKANNLSKKGLLELLQSHGSQEFLKANKVAGKDTGKLAKKCKKDHLLKLFAQLFAEKGDADDKEDGTANLAEDAVDKEEAPVEEEAPAPSPAPEAPAPSPAPEAPAPSPDAAADAMADEVLAPPSDDAMADEVLAPPSDDAMADEVLAPPSDDTPPEPLALPAAQPTDTVISSFDSFSSTGTASPTASGGDAGPGCSAFVPIKNHAPDSEVDSGGGSPLASDEESGGSPGGDEPDVQFEFAAPDEDEVWESFFHTHVYAQEGDLASPPCGMSTPPPGALLLPPFDSLLSPPPPGLFSPPSDGLASPPPGCGTPPPGCGTPPPGCGTPPPGCDTPPPGCDTPRQHSPRTPRSPCQHLDDSNKKTLQDELGEYW
jgi:hypothetical protein